MNSPNLKILIGNYKEAGRTYNTSPHVQNVFQWYCVVHGDVLMTLGGISHLLKANTSILIPPGSVRSPRCYQKAPGYMVVHLQLEGLSFESLLSKPVSMPTYLLPTLHALVEEFRSSSRPFSEALTQALVLQLLIGQERFLREKARSKASPSITDISHLNATRKNELVSGMEIFLSRRLHEKITREEVSEAFGLSSSHCARLFKEVSGKTIVERLTELRIARAKSALLDSTVSISEIAMDVGIESFSHFTRVFKAQVGLSPSDYRRSMGKVY